MSSGTDFSWFEPLTIAREHVPSNILLKYEGTTRNQPKKNSNNICKSRNEIALSIITIINTTTTNSITTINNIINSIIINFDDDVRNVLTTRL